MTILITGVAGFIGNQVALKLMVGTRAQAEALVAADNDWKDITYTFS